MFFLLILILVSPSVFAQRSTKETAHWRPVYHFTPPKNWTNDPNGLIYLNGEYHLYYQHNPFENKWGHMSWGHAVSKDLMNWKHLPVAIPERIDKDTTWIFSGSAVWDKENTSGFCKDGGCLVALYTAHQPNLKKESQFVAYSNDNGLTWTNYNKNPVLDLNKRDFRDPNVFWHTQTKQWIMVVSLPHEYLVQFYGSANLKEWTLLSEFGKQGDIAEIWECPTIIPLPVDGHPQQTKWVLLVSTGLGERGACMQYFVGDFDGKTFINNYSANTKHYVDYGRSFYAAIPWNNAPDNKKILLGWMVPGTTETFPWKGQMSIPRDMALKTTPEGVQLFQQPSAIISQSIAGFSKRQPMMNKNQALTDQEVLLNDAAHFNKNANWIELEFELGTAKSFGLKVAQKKGGDSIQETVIGYDVASNQLYVDRSFSGAGVKNKEKAIDKTLLKPENGKIKLQILLDKSSLEVFGNEGEKVISSMIYPDENATYLSLFAKNGTVKVKTFLMRDLSGVQPKQSSLK